MDRTTEKPRLPLASDRRRSAAVIGDLVREQSPPAGATLPPILTPATKGVDLAEWCALNRDRLQRTLAASGGLLFRGFDVHTLEQFQQVVRAASSDPLPYTERSSPRTEVGGHVYTSTDYPPDQPIVLHSENSYQATWPMKIFFWCQTPATQGGATPIADTRRLLARIDPELRERFRRRRVMYVRHYGDEIGLPWTTVFQTRNPAEVAAYCETRGIAIEWRDGGGLVTRQVRDAIRVHPFTGEPVWFNHLVFFHVTSLPPAIRDALRATLREDELPNNTYYGDGMPVEADVLDHLRDCYARETVAFPWTQGDVLMLDNMLAAHGRAPFAGARRVLVAMAEPHEPDGRSSTESL